MSTVVLYQTLENRGNFKFILANGPFKCIREDAWLSEGYYFWERFIENAHWWGAHCYGDKGRGYIICKAEVEFVSEKCFDLVGNTAHIEEFEDILNFIKGNPHFGNPSDITVSRVIRFMREQIPDFDYTSIRAYPLFSKHRNSIFSSTIIFKENSKSFIDLKPAFQFCYFEKESINIQCFDIVFPKNLIIY